MATKGAAKLKTLKTVFDALSDRFKEELQNPRINEAVNEAEVPYGFYLFQLLRTPYSDLCTEVVEQLLEYYICDENVFIFNNQRIGMTLEDVLYLTGLPISGEPVIKPKEYSHDIKGFGRLFGEDYKAMNKLNVCEMRKIVETRGNNENDDSWKKALLLLIIDCFITPNANGHFVDTAFCYYMDNLTRVNDYAWGAALLSYLFFGIRGFMIGIESNGQTKRKNSINGNVWLIICFVLIRIPKLRVALGVTLDMNSIQVPLMRSVVEQMRKLGGNHYGGHKDKVANILNNLTKEDIEWSPYNQTMFSGDYISLKDKVKYGTLVAPMFCNNYVAHHTPHLVADQFLVLERYDLAKIAYENYEIQHKSSSGKAQQDFKTFYKKELDLWNKQCLAQDLMPFLPDRDQDHGDSSETWSAGNFQDVTPPAHVNLRGTENGEQNLDQDRNEPEDEHENTEPEDERENLDQNHAEPGFEPNNQVFPPLNDIEDEIIRSEPNNQVCSPLNDTEVGRSVHENEFSSLDTTNRPRENEVSSLNTQGGNGNGHLVPVVTPRPSKRKAIPRKILTYPRDHVNANKRPAKRRAARKG